MKKILITCCILTTLIASLLLSCVKKDLSIENINTNNSIPFDAGTKITTAVAGRIIDENDKPLSNVSISIGSTTVTTDVFGSFFIPQANLNKNVGLISASKTGYFSGSRTIYAKPKTVNNVLIQLIKKPNSGNFSAASGGSIAVKNGGTILFPTNAITKNGNSYTGNVNVFAYYLDPSTKDAYQKMPGSLRGITTTNSEQQLTSYGMMAVELTDDNGNALQIATGKLATLTMPIPASNLNTAPATIPLWYFDEQLGMWKEQGSASKVGSNYVGDVSHFTWWNCDEGGGPITYTIKFVDQNGNPLSNQNVLMLPTNGTRGGGHGITASDGSITGNIPTNEPITVSMSLMGLTCSNTFVYSNQVGPFTQSTNGGTVTVNLSNVIDTIVFRGEVKDCNQQLVNGWAKITLGNNLPTLTTYINNGVLNYTYLNCTSNPLGLNATIQVFDSATLQTNANPIVVQNIIKGLYNIGTVTACGTQAFVRYTATFTDALGNGIPNGYLTTPKWDSIKYNNPNTIIIPANKVVQLRYYVYTNCGTMYDSLLIGPFSSDFNAGTIPLPVYLPTQYTITGTALDCNGNNITNGTAYFHENSDQLDSVTINNGSFRFSYISCSNQLQNGSVAVVNKATQQQNSSPVNFTYGNSNINLNTITACGLSTNEYLTINYAGTILNATYVGDTSWNSSSYVLNGYSANIFSASISGTNYSLGNQNSTMSLSYNSIYSSGNVSTNITEAGSTLQFFAGTFSGTLVDVNQVSKPVSGSFRIRRRQ